MRLKRSTITRNEWMSVASKASGWLLFLAVAGLGCWAWCAFRDIGELHDPLPAAKNPVHGPGDSHNAGETEESSVIPENHQARLVSGESLVSGGVSTTYHSPLTTHHSPGGPRIENRGSSIIQPDG